MNSSTQLEQQWLTIKSEAQRAAESEPEMLAFFHSSLLSHHSFIDAVSFILSEKIADRGLPAVILRQIIDQALKEDSQIMQRLSQDMQACFERDPACDRLMMPLLYFKGFQAIQLHRISHWLWRQGRKLLALDFQSRVSWRFGVDIHPAAQLGGGIMLDHATGLVVGETVVIGNNASILHGVTLGGSGRASGDRHPKIGEGVMIAAGAKILGNIRIGDGVKVGAGSLVLEPVPDHVTVAGVPAKIVGRLSVDSPALDMDQNLEADIE